MQVLVACEESQIVTHTHLERKESKRIHATLNHHQQANHDTIYNVMFSQFYGIHGIVFWPFHHAHI